MNQQVIKRVGVRIVGNHPHVGEDGFIVVEDGKVTLVAVPGSLRPDMVYVDLENCVHGTSGCFARQKDLRLASRHTRKGRRS